MDRKVPTAKVKKNRQVRWCRPVPGEAETVKSLLSVADMLAKRYVRRSVGKRSYDDAYADAQVGLLEAVRTYDSAKGVPLRAYAAGLAARRIIDGVRKDGPLTRRQVRDGMRPPDRLGDIDVAEVRVTRCACDDEAERLDDLLDEADEMLDALRNAVAELRKCVAIRKCGGGARQLMLWLEQRQEDGCDEESQTQESEPTV